MTSNLRRILSELRHWGVPGGVLLAGVALWVHLDPESPLLRSTLHGYPFAVYAVGGLLAWRLRRSRVVAALAAVGALAAAPELLPPPQRVPGLEIARGAVVPLGWVGLSLLDDRPLLSRRGAVSLAVVVLLFGGAAAALTWAPGPVLGFLDTPLELPVVTWTPTAAQLIVGAAGLALLVVSVLRRSPVERALFWSLLAVEAGLLFGPAAAEGAAFLMAGGVILGVAVVEGSYLLAYHDELTGLPARRALGHDMERLGRRYTVAMVDVDHFKRFNDRHGHDVGDQVLRMVASRLRRAPGGARAFRYGGEEFTLLFPGMGREEAAPHLEAVREAVEAAEFVVRGPGRRRKGAEHRGKGASSSRKSLSVTVSVGAAEPEDAAEDPHRVLDRADKALYRAKKKGRNRVETG